MKRRQKPPLFSGITFQRYLCQYLSVFGSSPDRAVAERKPRPRPNHLRGFQSKLHGSRLMAMIRNRATCR
jgi:hypothetical protein